MNPFKTHTGIVAPLDRSNIDTDAILPKQFMKRIEKKGFGKYLFYDWRYTEDKKENPNFILNKKEYRDATILLTRENFGCGSSREHAPWALEDYGFRVIIAPSFADIFYNNCFRNGILPIKLSEIEVQRLFDNTYNIEGYQLLINLETKTITDNNGLRIVFNIDSYRRNMLLAGLDEIGLTIKNIKQINEFEEKHKIYYTL